MKRSLVFLTLLLLVIFVACRGVSATQVERELYSRIDKGDVAGALALITDDAVFLVKQSPGCAGVDKGRTSIARIAAGPGSANNEVGYSVAIHIPAVRISCIQCLFKIS